MRFADILRTAVQQGGGILRTKVIFEGDSITSLTSPNSMANQWIAANPSVTSANLSVSGAKIRSNSGNSLDERRSALVAAASGYSVVLPILIGTNDLAAASDVATWESSLLQYISDVRASIAGIKIGVGLLLPVDESVALGGTTPGRTGFNARRATVNAWLRTQVGSTIDFIIPYGEHPVMGPDAAAFTGAYSDGVHPSSSGFSYMLSVLQAVLDPIIAGTSGATPTAFSFSDFATATASTVYTATTTITGMGMGQSANASVTGTGTVSRGTDAAGTGPTAVMNGDILTSSVTSSATGGATVQHTLAVGSRSDTWDITTASSSATTVWNQSFGIATLHYPSSREVKGPLSTETGYNGTSAAKADKGYAVSSATKRYFEMKFTSGAVGSNGGPWNVSVIGSNNANNNRPGFSNTNGGAGVTYRSDGNIYRIGTTTASGTTFGASDTIGVAIDYNTNTVWFLKNGVSINGDPVAGTGGYALTASQSATWFAGAVCQRNEGHILNCGQDPFTNSPPTGFVAYG